jgi:hypothetical protein
VAWFHGAFTPFIDPLVADGQGLVTLATHGVTGGVNLSLITLAGALAYVAIVASFVVWYRSLKRAWPLLLPVVFFFSARSLSSYLVDLFPVAVLGLLTVAPAPPRPARSAGTAPSWAPSPPSTAPLAPARLAPVWRSVRARPWLAVAVPVAGVVVASALALSSAPLQLVVRSVGTTAHDRLFDAVTVTVDNRTGATVTPHFLVNTGDNPDGFWHRAGGGAVEVGPHTSDTVTLYPPAVDTAPQPGARWLVEAYTTDPRALSTSSLVLWRGRR